MRPRLLEIEAMGPFGGPVTVDFEELAVDGLFLIHGPTGAGKTSLLDGVCFALYGRVPGARGKAKSDRSHHAAWGVAPRAELTFDAQGGTYQVVRTPQWDAPKARGNGTTPKPATAVLRRIDPGHEQVIGTRAAEVDREIERLVGLSAPQFQQVILLPQGEFERFLRSNSREREEVLETLFDTLDYKVATEWLDQQAKVRRLEVERLRQRLSIIGDEALRRAEDVLRCDTTPVPPPSSGTGGATTLLDRPRTVLDGDPLEPATLDDLVVALTETAERLEAELVTAEATERSARRAHDRAALVAERLDRRQSLLQELAMLDAAEPAMTAIREQVERAGRAGLLRNSLDEVRHHREVVDRAVAAVAADLQTARTAVAALVLPAPNASALDLTAVPPSRRVDAAVRELSSSRAVLDGLRAAAERASTAEAEIRRCSRTAERHAAQAVAARRRVADLHDRRPALADALDAARAAAERSTTARDAATAAAARADAAIALAKTRPQLARAEDALRTARDTHAERREEHQTARERYLDGIAADLAGRLALDEPCLVCGSPDHPAPAQPTEDAVAKETVEALGLAVEHAEAHRDRVAETVQALTAEAAGFRAIAGELADDPAAAKTAAADAARHRDATVALAAEGPRRRQALETLDADVEAATAATLVADEAVTAAREQIAVLTERAATARDAMAEHLPPTVDLEAAITALDRAINALGRVADHAAGNQEATAKLHAARQRVERELADSPFADEDEARAALLPDGERQRLEDRLVGHHKRRTETTAQLGDPHLADLPETAGDLKTLTEALAAAEDGQRRCRDRLTLTGNARTAVVGLAADHREVAKRHQTADADATLYDTVAERCSGRSGTRIALQRWVLGTYLEEVCGHANRRLASMTSGRYQLRVTRTPARANAPAGLDLRVHDANTNREREVSTLSGGETFQASLALALGVADSVEAHTGGVRIDALFIDEGFGTLDADALELAMDELDTLREGGRMVGVISHVAGLRERIHLGLEVRKADDGSTVEIGSVS